MGVMADRSAISYSESIEGIGSGSLFGFFVGWPNPPSPETHLRLLQQSDHVVVALNSDRQVVGFVTAISDGVLSAYIPLLEVLPDYQHRGIGHELMRLLLARLEGLYMVDLMCNPELKSFYHPLGFQTFDSGVVGMVIRRFDCQAGLPERTAKLTK